LKWYDGGGENEITSKRIFEVEVFFSSQNIEFPIYLRRHLEFFFFFTFLPFFLFFYAPSLEDLGGGGGEGGLMIFEEKITSSKTSFQMACHGHDYGYSGGGRIFRNGVMHTNMAKP
jgi:hypothetical protein